MLLRRRDVGGGLIAERPGAPAASATLERTLRAGVAAAARDAAGVDDRVCASTAHSSAAWWTPSAKPSPAAAPSRDIVSRLGGIAGLEDAFITIAFSFLAVAARRHGDLVDTAAAQRGKRRSAARPFWPVRSAGSVGPQAISSLPSQGRRWRYWPRAGRRSHLRHRQRRRRRKIAGRVDRCSAAAAGHLAVLGDHRRAVRARARASLLSRGACLSRSSRCISSARCPACRSGYST